MSFVEEVISEKLHKKHEAHVAIGMLIVEDVPMSLDIVHVLDSSQDVVLDVKSLSIYTKSGKNVSTSSPLS